MNKSLILNELLPIYQMTDTGEQVVDARELCGFLDVGRDFTSWIKGRIEKYSFIEDEDFIITLTKTGERQNVTRHDYILKLDMAKELAMVENNDQGRKARRYFIEVEKRFRKDGPLVPLGDATITNKLAAIDKSVKLLQLLRVSVKDGFLSSEHEAVFRRQIADQVLEESADSPRRYEDDIPSKYAIPEKGSSLSEYPSESYTGRWYSTKEMAVITGSTVNMIGKLASEHRLRTPEYTRVEAMNGERLSGLHQLQYNEAGKDKLIQLVSLKKLSGYVPKVSRKVRKRK
ncbi:antA/AntB antirepressor family protein [Paenibacillus sp. 11B]|uniref:antA/AntB antirepressor family protein n=1 Tax=Paenibacillus sp. 11B TaxID=3060965 RepID=UPI00264B2387|nr:antA/AntB antirepressor family protein [Paenibacillus sp. 11B]MDN8591917.1 antA/AntB antirepressor family protein [Paenibacillus sp. 11B]